LLEQLAFPCVPHFRAGTANVGDGEQIEGHQLPLVLHRRGKCAHDVRVGDILFLGNAGHQQMTPDQPDDQFAVLCVDAVICTELRGIDGTKFRVVATSPLGDVVEQRCDVEHPGTREITDQLAAQRILVSELAGEKAAQVAQDLQAMLVDGVDVEQVVLHLADDPAEIGQVAAKQSELVHAPEFVQHAARLFEDFQESGARLPGRAAEAVVDQCACMPQGAQSARRHPLQLGMPLHQQEGLENGARVLPEEISSSTTSSRSWCSGSVH
jgi:hypothetical protein